MTTAPYFPVQTPHRTAGTRDAALLIRQLKGAPATILLMMLAIGRPTGRDELALLTTYSEHTIQKALNQLQFIGLAQQHARRDGWALTSAVRRQLLTFPTPAPQLDPEPGEAESGEAESAEAEPPEVQTLHLDTLPAPAPEVMETHPSTPNSAGEVQSLHLAGSSSSLSDSSLLRKESEQQQPTLTATEANAVAWAHATPRDPPPPAARPAVTLDPVNLDAVEADAVLWDADARDAVQLLTATGCPHHTASGKGARDAVQAALAGGWTGAQIYDHVADWFDYVESTEGIKHKGLFTAARIRNLEPAPTPRPKTTRRSPAQLPAYPLLRARGEVPVSGGEVPVSGRLVQ